MEVCDSTSVCFTDRPYLRRQPYDLSPAAAAAAAVVASATTVSSANASSDLGLRFAYPNYPSSIPQYTNHHSHPLSATTPYLSNISGPVAHQYAANFNDPATRKLSSHYDERTTLEVAQQSYAVHANSDPYGYLHFPGHYSAKSVTEPTAVSTSVASTISPGSATNTTISNALQTLQVKPFQSTGEFQRAAYFSWNPVHPNGNNSPVVDTSASEDASIERAAGNGTRKCIESSRVAVTNKLIPTATCSDLLLHHASNFSQWDVNDPKLPKIRQFDTFTMWPQGHCRYAYQKSASEGARRHASGWAMRNTNNHNAQILKKSCLGVLLCTADGCPLAMRPAICDKARRRQEGRSCCMPNCTGHIYNQPCRGHGGYPVTHFWREHGDTVYFQSKGTHDHVRPDLKPVRDTAARRRRQMQLEKLQHARTLTASNDGSVRTTSCFAVRANLKSAQESMRVGLGRKRAIDRLESNRLHESNHIGNADSGKVTSHCSEWNSPPEHGKVARSTFVNAKSNQFETVSPTKPEPIFPSSPSIGTYMTSHVTETPECRSPKFGSVQPVNPVASFRASDASNNRYPLSVMYSIDRATPQTTQPNPNDSCSMPSVITSSFMKQLLYEEELKRPNMKTTYPVTNSYPDISVYSSLCKPQVLQNSTHQQTMGGGPNSESTSGGLNASWSTPSPPTGGSSSLFGASELRNFVGAIDEGDVKDNLNSKTTLHPQAWRPDLGYATTVSGQHTVSPSRLNLGGYGLSTPTSHTPYGIQALSALNSPDSLMASSVQMSSSTPLSNGSALVNRFAQQLTQSGASYPAGYITPIPFYLNGSDSRSTRTSSSSGERTSQESGPLL